MERRGERIVTWKGWKKLKEGKTVFRLPDNVTPNRIIVVREGERVDIYYGNKGERDHGHSVFKGGKQVYARSRKGSLRWSSGE